MFRLIVAAINIFFFIFFAGPLEVAGLDPKTPVTKFIHHIWTTGSGLPQNTIHSIVQDNNGYLWLGTERGIARFDGTWFRILNKGNTPAIRNNFITSLFISGDGALWIGTYGGGIIRYKDSEFKNYSIEDGLTNHFINAIAEDHDQNLWFGTTGDGVIQLKNEKFISITREKGLAYDIVNCLLSDSKGRLWIGTEKGLNCINKGRITLFTTANGLPTDNIKTIFQDHRGRLWVGTTDGVGFIRRPKDLKKKKFIVLDTQDGLSSNLVHSIIQDTEGNIWIAAEGGLSRIKSESLNKRIHDKIDLHLEHFTSQDGLSDDSLLSLYEDRWGNLWVGTYGGGLNVLRDGKFDFLTEEDGLTSDYTTAIYEDAKKTLWIGTSGGGLNQVKEEEIITYTKKDGLSSNYIQSLCDDREGNLWIGTNNGLNRFKNGQIDIFTTRQGLSNNSIKSLYLDSKDNLWIGTFGGGLNRFFNGRFEYFDKENGLSDNFVLALEEDNYGNLWIGTNRGLNCFDGQLFRHFGASDGIPQGRILDIYCDPIGVLWIATHDEGLIRYKNAVFTPFKSTGGFTGHAIYRILEDHRQNLWLSSNKGIFSVSRRQLNRYMNGGNSIDWQHFQEGDGLKTSVCSGGFQPAGWKTSDERIWFPTLKGAAVMDLRKPKFPIENQSNVPDIPGEIGIFQETEGTVLVTVVRQLLVHIEKVIADNRDYNPDSYFILPSKTEKIEFHFASVDLESPGNIVFQYRLIGYDKKWIRITNRKSVVYHNLPAGDYEFKVLARRSDGQFVYGEASCVFSIKPPFVQTFWFFFLLSLGFSTIIIGLPRAMEIMAKKKIEKEEKYKSSTLGAHKSKKLLHQLLKIMTEEKPFLDPELSLQKLAARMEITKEDLSQIINEQLDRNFKNFINEYRVEEAKNKLLDPKENQFVLMKIAFDVGFNSKSVFNASFKKFTGMSPSQYRKKHQEK
jgi:ligand-binding sensor domain-containing protein/AraC-like DNA-binding protein